MNQPVGEKRTPTQPERIKKRDKDIFVENFNFVQRAPLSNTTHRQKAVEIRGFVFDSQSSDAPAWPHCAVATGFNSRPQRWDCAKYRRKRKTRPGGQPDGSSYMGAWGGWALAPNTASVGRDCRSHPYRSPEGSLTFKALLTFLAGSFRWQNNRLAGLLRSRLGLAIGRLVGRQGSRRSVQSPRCGDIPRVRSAFGGGRGPNPGGPARQWGDDGRDRGIGIRFARPEQIV